MDMSITTLVTGTSSQSAILGDPIIVRILGTLPKMETHREALTIAELSSAFLCVDTEGDV
jgi:hypothetical protein